MKAYKARTIHSCILLKTQLIYYVCPAPLVTMLSLSQPTTPASDGLPVKANPGTGVGASKGEVADPPNQEIPDMEDDLELEAAMLLVEENPEEMLSNPPLPAKNNLRFADLEDADIDKLQKASKSDRTHKSTRWGLNIIQG